MATKGQKPRQGWIYMINPTQTLRSCKKGHNYLYDHTPDYEECKHKDCSLNVNPSRVHRGTHPYIVWQFEGFTEKYETETVWAIPMTSQDTFSGLPTSFPIRPNKKNGLTKLSHALVHQITTVDLSCFRDIDPANPRKSVWKPRIGQLAKGDKKEINDRIHTLSGTEADDWFTPSIEAVESWLDTLPEDERLEYVERLFAKYV